VATGFVDLSVNLKVVVVVEFLVIYITMQTLRPACRSLQLFAWHSCTVRCASFSNSSNSTIGKLRECDVVQLPLRDVIIFPYLDGCTFKGCCGHVQKSHMSTSAEGFSNVILLQNYL